MRKYILSLAAFAMQIAVCAQNVDISTIPKEKFQIYLAFGQSNMEGQGPIEASDLDVPDRFLALQAVDCTNSKYTKDVWRKAKPPICRCWTNLCPLDYFGRGLLEKLPSDVTVGVINVAVAGCSIDMFDKDKYKTYINSGIADWMKNIVNDYGGNPYGRLIELAKQAQRVGVIKGILLHQGESNTGDATWPARVNKIYQDILTDLGLSASQVPLLVGEVANKDQNGACSYMNTVIDDIQKTIPTAYVISSSGCTCQSDNVHFSSAGYRLLGSRYASKMLQLLGATTGIASLNTDDGTSSHTVIISDLNGRPFLKKTIVDMKDLKVNCNGIPVGVYIISLIKSDKTLVSTKYYLR
jgi:alpha-L-fucosidase 2